MLLLDSADVILFDSRCTKDMRGAVIELQKQQRHIQSKKKTNEKKQQLLHPHDFQDVKVRAQVEIDEDYQLLQRTHKIEQTEQEMNSKPATESMMETTDSKSVAEGPARNANLIVNL